MAKSPTAMVHELEVTIAVLKEHIRQLQEAVGRLVTAVSEGDAAAGEALAKVTAELARVSERVTRLEERVEQLRREITPTTTTERELAVLKADFAEFKERAKAKETWGRGLIASGLVALSSSVVALIVALVRK